MMDNEYERDGSVMGEADQNVELPSSSSSAHPGSGTMAAPPKQPADGETIERSEDSQPSVWAPYVCRTIQYGKPHPGKLVEASVLAAVDLPPCTYPLQDSLHEQIEKGTLSRMQLEGIAYACQRHGMRIGDKVRAGFYLGDSAGVGKGRQISGIILDNLVRGRKKHCWFSVSHDLHLDATRDLRDIGCQIHVIPSIAAIEDLKATGQFSNPGIVFSTYSGLISAGKANSKKTRFDELVEWLMDGKPPHQFDGVIVFDEAHKAKNFRPDSRMSTQSGQKVFKLQEMFPNARVVYASATCVSNVDDMQYMTRLGYWGPEGCAYKDFPSFKQALQGADVSGMELLAVDMKTTGRAVVRNVSYEDATFRLATADLTPKQAQLYRDACNFWSLLFIEVEAAKKECARGDPGEEMDDDEMDEEEAELQAETDANGDAAMKEAKEENLNETQKIQAMYRHIMAQYWGCHQRFFAQLLLSFKVDLVVKEVKEEMAKGKCAVIGLQSTGEVALNRALLEEGLGGDVYTDGITSVCKSIARRFIRKFFPVTRAWVPKDGEYAFYQPSSDELLEALTDILANRGLSEVDGNAIKQKIFDYAYDRTKLDEVNWPMFRQDGTVVSALRRRMRLLGMLESLELPPTALDDLIDKLGGPDKVAEMTGRTIRQVRNSNGKFKVETRAMRTRPGGDGSSSSAGRSHSSSSKKSSNQNELPSLNDVKWWADANNAQTDSLNVIERTEFLQGKKNIAVISAAASTGISLHADRMVANQKQRFHCTLELPWAADQAIQQLGRSHRTNQVSAPLFCLISSGLGAENRFVSSVARRLQSLGALTQGDRRASLGAMSIGDLRLESAQGTVALLQMFKHISTKQEPGVNSVAPGVKWEDVVKESQEMIELDMRVKPNLRNVCIARRCETEQMFLAMIREALRALNMKVKNVRARKNNDPTKNPLVTRFLNRLLGLPFAHQSLLFNYFCAILEVLLQNADRGFLALEGKISRLQLKRTVYRDAFGREVFWDKLEVNRRMDFPQAMAEVRYLIQLSKNPMMKREQIPVDPMMPPHVIEKHLYEALKIGVQFYVKPDGKGANLVLCTRGPTKPNGQRSVIRPQTGYSAVDLDEAGLNRVYRPCMEPLEIERKWKMSLTQRTDLGVIEMNIVTGSLVPILGDILMVDQNVVDEHGRGKSPLKAYLGMLGEERILGVKVENIESLVNVLSTRSNMERTKVVTFPAVSLQAIRNNDVIDFGFEINSNGRVIMVTQKGRDMGVEKGSLLSAINVSGFSPNPVVKDVNTAVRFYVFNSIMMQAKKSSKTPLPEYIAVSFNFLISETHQRQLVQARDIPAPVQYSLIESMTMDPLKLRKKIGKIERKCAKLFDSDSDDDILISTSSRKKKTSKEEGEDDDDVVEAESSSKQKKKSGSKRAKICDEEKETPTDLARRSSSLPEPPIAKKLTFMDSTRILSTSSTATLSSEEETPIVRRTQSMPTTTTTTTTTMTVSKKIKIESSIEIASVTTTTISENVKEKKKEDKVIELDDDEILNFSFRLSKKNI